MSTPAGRLLFMTIGACIAANLVGPHTATLWRCVGIAVPGSRNSVGMRECIKQGLQIGRAAYAVIKFHNIV